MNTLTNHWSIQTKLLALSTAVLLGLTLTLSGCGNGLSGEKYVDEGGKDGIEFKSGNKAYVTEMGQIIEVDYEEVDDDKIKLDTHGESGTVVLTRHDDGTITGLPMSGTLKKKDE